MLKIKLLTVLGILGFVTIVLNMAPVFVSKAEGDNVLREIAGYKTWSKITKEPIKVDGKSDGKTTFIIDGEEVTNFRTGDLGG